MQRMFTRWWVLVLCLVFFTEIQAQDLHFSQFQHSPLNHNPALTGIFNGDKRFAANFRRQWFAVPVDYLTFSASYDRKFLPDGANSFWSAGAVFNYDRAGDADLSMAYLGLHGSYTFGFSPSVFVTAGATIGGGQRSLRTTEILWGNYWDGERVDPTLPSGEPNFDDNKFFFDLGGGLNLRLQESSRTKLDVGIGLFHLNEPNNTFYNDASVKLPVRTALQANGSLKLFDAMDLLVNGLVQFEGPYQEVVLGGMLNFHISQKKAREVQFAVGVGYRLDDALIPQIAVAYDGWRAGFSYDVNTSIFDVATNQRGGPEFSLIYIITDVRPLPETKLCKIF
ncbi:MAG: PorP/SprF family type IX secretion system membrane protein [Saprospiraceae bacterium]|nr:PorP/SprF family type IX secretion system membrane protein [Saprospiraceae bacterium]